MRDFGLAQVRETAILHSPQENSPLPKIGLLSDSHGRASTTRRAVEMLLESGAQVILHLGDLGTLEVIDALVMVPEAGREPLDVRLVFGNVDWDRASMGRYAVHLGVKVEDPVGRLTLTNADGAPRTLIYLHGDDAVAMTDALEAQPNYLCHGHSHHTRDDREGKTRIINPGALFRAQSYTVALLDTETDQLTFLPVE